jgi:hypothetical protein
MVELWGTKKKDSRSKHEKTGGKALFLAFASYSLTSACYPWERPIFGYGLQTKSQFTKPTHSTFSKAVVQLPLLLAAGFGNFGFYFFR